MAARPKKEPGPEAGGVYVALLRGVNVGGKNLLPMAALAAMFQAAGCDAVQTYIQSGNVLFAAPRERAERIIASIRRSIASRYGFEAPIVVRTARELAAVVRDNPFLASGADPKTLHVVFLLDRPAPTRVAALDPSVSPPDEFVVRGREIYLRCPNGVGRSKLIAPYFDARLATTSTSRNWNTVLKLATLAGAAGQR